jgi:hypothetical protein
MNTAGAVTVNRSFSLLLNYNDKAYNNGPDDCRNGYKYPELLVLVHNLNGYISFGFKYICKVHKS